MFKQIKERFTVLSKKKKIILVATIGILILAIVLVMSGGKKLSGSFIEADNNRHRYEFLRSSTTQGDYGGTLNEYYSGELRSTSSWYVEDNVVYIDGRPQYLYDGNVLHSDEPEDGITVEPGNYLSGSNEDFGDQRRGGMMFIHDGKNRNAYYYNYNFLDMLTGIEGTYKVEGNFVYICDEYERVDDTLYIVGNELYNHVWLPV